MQTQNLLLSEAERLVRTRGFDAMSFADLATAADIRKASVHYHFPTKADLAAKMIARYRAQVAEDLTAVWYEKYDADAFVNAWDVANYVSDYLTSEAGNESCECSAKIH